MTPSTVHRLLAQLEEEGLVRREGEGRYRLGLQFLRAAWLAAGARTLREIADPFLRTLVAEAGETAILAQYEPGRREACVVATVESAQPVRFVSDVSEWRSLHAGAIGRAILAFLPEAEREAIITAGLQAMTTKTLTDRGALERELEATRARGYALSVEERRPGAVGVAAAVLGPGGGVVASVGVALPAQRFHPRDERRLATAVKRTAGAIGAAIGAA